MMCPLEAAVLADPASGERAPSSVARTGLRGVTGYRSLLNCPAAVHGMRCISEFWMAALPHLE